MTESLTRDPLENTISLLLENLASFQNPDGGFPGSFRGDASGCWTTSELYAGLALYPRSTPVGDELTVRAERFLLGVLERQGDGGLPHIEQPPAHVPGQRSSLSIVDSTAAFLTGWRARHPTERDTTRRLTDWLLEARAAGPGSGFGLRPGDGMPRTYSTAGALMALFDEPSTHADAETLLLWRDQRSGAWPFRPGASPSRLGTGLALAALAPTGVISDRQRAESTTYLMEALTSRNWLEEDAMSVAEGYELQFGYAPRLVALARVLEWLKDTPSDYGWNIAATALAEAEMRLVTTERPCPEVADVRSWHFIDLIYGHGGVLMALDALSAAQRARFDKAFDDARRSMALWSAARELPLPLQGEALRLARGPGTPAATSRCVATHMEQTFQLIDVVLMAGLRSMGQEGRAALMTRLATPSRGLSDLYRSQAALRGLEAGGAPPPIVGRLQRRLATARRESPTKKALKRLSEHRNQVAHGWPLSSPKGVGGIVADWLLWLAALRPLREVQLVSLTRIAHDAVSGEHVYAWADVDAQDETGLYTSDATLSDLLQLPGLPELRATFVRDRTEPTAPLLSLLPFVMMGYCEGCGAERLWVYARHEATGREESGQTRLALRCVDRCGTTLQVVPPPGVLEPFNRDARNGHPPGETR